MFNVIEKTLEQDNEDEKKCLHSDFAVYEQFSNEKRIFMNSYKKTVISRIKESLEFHRKIKEYKDKELASKMKAELRKRALEEKRKRAEEKLREAAERERLRKEEMKRRREEREREEKERKKLEEERRKKEL